MAEMSHADAQAFRRSTGAVHPLDVRVTPETLPVISVPFAGRCERDVRRDECGPWGQIACHH
jgi:hypothetical protein